MSSSVRSSIIKGLQSGFQRGRPLHTSDLRRARVSNALAYRYVQHGWMEKLGRGTFMFAGDELQRDSSLGYLAERFPGLHIGGKTALALRGKTHNILFRETLTLWGPKNVRLPEWFVKRFASRYTSRELFSDELTQGFCLSPLQGEGVPVSEPERALLEMLSEVGTRQEVEEARNIMELLGSLRREPLLLLLRACRQTKTVRLCVQWAKELGLPWATQAEEALSGVTGKQRWVRRLVNGRTLILNPV